VYPPGAHEYVYGAVPPVIVTEAVPLLVQVTEVVVTAKVIDGAALMVIGLLTFLQPLESVVVNVYDPAQRPEVAVVVFPLDHK
jgi:hypothetical protein